MAVAPEDLLWVMMMTLPLVMPFIQNNLVELIRGNSSH
jgi:hypothetical protein